MMKSSVLLMKITRKQIQKQKKNYTSDTLCKVKCIKASVQKKKKKNAKNEKKKKKKRNKKIKKNSEKIKYK